MKFRTKFRFVSKIDQLHRRSLRTVNKWLGHVGGYVRLVARRSLKQARRMSPGELSDDQFDRWIMLNNRRAARGLGPPLTPMRHSKPGQIPLLQERRSPLKYMLTYAKDLPTKAVLIGPQRARKGTAWRLEHGDVTLAIRPFMAPAERKARPNYVNWWREAITRTK